jgi:hypothetical protein
VEEVTKGTIHKAAVKAMRNISGQYLVYEFNATLDGTAVQPDGTVTVDIKLPNTFWHEESGFDVTLYYLAPDGTLEKQEAELTRTGSFLSAKLPHFSTYILADNLSEPPAGVLGDVTGDGSVNSMDLVRMQKYASSGGDGSVTVSSFKAADVNADGKFNAKDLTRLKKYVASGGDGSVELG